MALLAALLAAQSLPFTVAYGTPADNRIVLAEPPV